MITICIFKYPLTVLILFQKKKLSEMSYHFQEPPHEVIWTEILSYLKMKDIESCRLVSRGWKKATDEVIKNNCLMKAKLRREVNAEIAQIPWNQLKKIELQTTIEFVVQRICPKNSRLSFEPESEAKQIIDKCFSVD